MNNYLIDTHCHLDIIEQHGQTIQDSLSHAQQAGIRQLLQIGINYETSLRAIEIASVNSSSELSISYSIGCHPADTIADSEIEQIEALIQEHQNNPGLVGIGEIGLDYYHKDNHNEQKQVFTRFLSLAKSHNLPVIIHSRDAAQDTLNILQDFAGDVRGVIHCFTYDSDMAKKFVALGYYISFSGILTFKNAKDIHQAARDIPLNAILLETDAPFLAPTPYRGKRNEPAYLPYMLAKVQSLRDESDEQVATQIQQNSQNFLNRKVR